MNGVHSEWFDVNTGLKQGCVLSPLFFNAFVNDLTLVIKSLNCGIPVSLESSISILLYADDIVLLSESEANMQIMLDYLGNWWKTLGLTINFNKSKVMHFRAPSKQRTEYNFKCSSSSVDLIQKYKYLGLLFTEHLDLMQMTKIVAQSASRALGLLISKDKVFGAMPFACFTRCYGATVQSIIDYSAAI